MVDSIGINIFNGVVEHRRSPYKNGMRDYTPLNVHKIEALVDILWVWHEYRSELLKLYKTNTALNKLRYEIIRHRFI